MTVGDPSIDAPHAAERQHANWRYAQRHSRRVRVLRIGLPAIAAAITLAFVISFRSLPSGVDALDLGDVGVEGSTLTMESPKLTGFSSNGLGYDVTAKRAMQELSAPNFVRLQGISGRATQPDGSWATLDAASGTYDSDREFLTLKDDIVVRTNDGKRGRLSDVTVDLRKQRVVSNQRVELTMPGGRVEADRLLATGSGEVVRLHGNVVVELRMNGGATGEASHAQD